MGTGGGYRILSEVSREVRTVINGARVRSDRRRSIVVCIGPSIS